MMTLTKRKIFGKQGIQLALGMLSFKYLTPEEAYSRQFKAQSGFQRDRFWSHAYKGFVF